MRKAVMATLMLMTLAGNVVAIAVLPLVLGIAAISGAGFLGYYFGTNSVNQTYVQELEQKYQQLLTSSKQTNDKNIQQMLLEVYARDQNLYGLGSDFGEYTKNYAWALAKFKALEALKAGKTPAEAKAAAKMAVMDYYYNVTQTLINNFDATNRLLNKTLNEYPNYAGVSQIVAATYKFTAVGYSNNWFKVIYDPVNNKWTAQVWVTSPYYSNRGVYSAKVYLETESKLIVGKQWSYNVLHGYVRFKASQYSTFTWNAKVKTVEYSGVEVYNNTLFYSAINQINTAYNQIINEIDLYVDNLAASVDLTNVTIDKFYDPYILASQFNSDLNASGYAGYAAAELALLGFNTTGINKTITIAIGNKTVTGWLFTTWGGTIQANNTYTADMGKWYILTDNGLYEIPQGTTFKVVALKDMAGNTLTNTTLKSYTSATADTAKIYDELAALRQLWEEYLTLQATASGAGASGSNSLSAWWNGLDTIAKAGIISIGAVGVYAVLRRK